MQPEVRLLAEGTEEILGYLPLDAPALNMGNHVVLVGGATYKVEQMRYTVEDNTVVAEGGATRQAIYGRLDYIVSVVP